MDYPIAGGAPNVADGVMPHVLDGNGKAAPQSAQRAWTMPALVATNAGSATTVLAAGLAVNGLMIVNEDATNPVRLRFDGSDATSVLGLPLAAGKGVFFAQGQVPSGKISAYGASAVNLSVAYC